jgi:hypothetical protein
MKNAPTKNSSESALNTRNYIAVGARPKRTNTVRAAVLASLIEGKELTGMESVFAQSTTRLSAVIYALETEYSWAVARRNKLIDTKDGRSAWITAYWLPPTSIELAMAMGARQWVDEVKAARIERQQRGYKKKQEEARAKAARNQLRKQDPRQRSLWGD